MPSFPSPLRDRLAGRWPKRPLLDHVLAVAAVALLLLSVSGEVRGALGDLMAQVDGAQAAAPTR